MARYEVRCEVEVPDELNATDKQVQEWVTFELHETCMMESSPLSSREFSAVRFSVEVTLLPIRQNPVVRVLDSSDDPYGGL